MLTGVDWILLGVLVFSMAVGAWRGLVFEVLSLIGWVVSFYLAQWYAPQLAVVLDVQSLSDPLRHAAAFLLIFVAALFASGLLAYAIKKLVTSIGLRPIDRVLGAMFGAARGVVLLLAATLVVEMTPLRSSEWWTASEGARSLSATLAVLKPLLPEPFAKYLG